jgi:P pilus assembly chaperone PapD
MSRLRAFFLCVCLIGTLSGSVNAQTAGLGIRPMRLEMEVVPGKSKTASFLIESPPSDEDVRGRLILSLTDWVIHEDTTVSYVEAGSQSMSASPWIVFSPSDVTISSGQERLVRVTANVPVGTPPGVYRSALFVQERPPARQPKAGERLVFFRFRYVVTIYVIVQPVSGKGEIADLQLTRNAQGLHLVCQLKNNGTRHLRPSISWFLRSDSEEELVAEKNVETTVLLPAATTKESLTIPLPLSPGEYEIEAQVDFHDGQALQTIKRKVDIVSLSAHQ